MNNTSLELISEELDDDNKHKTLTYHTKSPITPESPNFFRFKVTLVHQIHYRQIGLSAELNNSPILPVWFRIFNTFFVSWKTGT